MQTKMTASELKYNVEINRNEPFFFDRKTMKFFGDTMRNYGVTSATIPTLSGEMVEVWELFRRKPVKHGLSSSAYFTKNDFQRIYKKE